MGALSYPQISNNLNYFSSGFVRRPQSSPLQYDHKKEEWVSRQTDSFIPTIGDIGSYTNVGLGTALAGGVIGWGASSLADKLTNGGYTKALEGLKSPLPEKGSAPSPVPLDDSVLNPWAPSEFTFNNDNAPGLLAGTMQSAEMVSLSIGSLTQIVADTHNEHMGVLASKMQLDYSFQTQLIENFVTLNVVLAGVIQQLSDSTNASAVVSTTNAENLSATVGALGEVIAPISSSIKDKVPVEIVQQDLTNLDQWAEFAKKKVSYETTAVDVKDLDGNVIANLSPMELQAIKNASDARLRTDQNNFEVEDNDFLSPMASFPSIPFIGRESVYNPSFSPPVKNPFLPEGL